MVGIHSLPIGARGPDYEDEVMTCLLDGADDISRGDAIVAGDFNVGPEVADLAKKSFVERAAALWSELGLVSAYHHFFEEDLLAPTRSTHDWRYNPGAPWHIDYVVLPRSRIDRLRGVYVGGYDEGIAKGFPCRSDHVPLIVDIDWT